MIFDCNSCLDNDITQISPDLAAEVWMRATGVEVSTLVCACFRLDPRKSLRKFMAITAAMKCFADTAAILRLSEISMRSTLGFLQPYRYPKFKYIFKQIKFEMQNSTNSRCKTRDVHHPEFDNRTDTHVMLMESSLQTTSNRSHKGVTSSTGWRHYIGRKQPLLHAATVRLQGLHSRREGLPQLAARRGLSLRRRCSRQLVPQTRTACIEEVPISRTLPLGLCTNEGRAGPETHLAWAQRRGLPRLPFQCQGLQVPLALETRSLCSLHQFGTI